MNVSRTSTFGHKGDNHMGNAVGRIGRADKSRPRGWGLIAGIAAGTLVMSTCLINSLSPVGAASASSSSNSWVGKPAHGTPVKFGWLIDLSAFDGDFVPYSDDVLSEVKAANADGGIHGHPIELMTCDLAGSENTAAACGQQMVSDHVVGVLALPQEDTFEPYLEKAHIPVVSPGGISPLLDTRGNSFAPNDGGALASVGEMAELHSHGCTNVSALIDVPGLSAGEIALVGGRYQAAATYYKMTYGGTFTVPSSDPDEAATVDEAANSASCLLTTSGGPAAISMLNAVVPLVQEGKLNEIVDYGPSLDTPGSTSAETPMIDELGSHLLNVAGLESTADTSNPVVAKFLHDTTKYNTSSTPPLNGTAEDDWVNLQLLIQSANAIYPKLTASKLLYYMNHLKSWWPGLFPTVSFTGAGDLKLPSALGIGSRDFNSWVATFGWTSSGLNLPRTSAFLSLVTGVSSNNVVPAKANVKAFE